MRKVGGANSFAGSLHSKVQSDKRLMPFAEKFGVQPDIVHNIRDIMNIECPSRLSGEPYERYTNDTSNYNSLKCSVNSTNFRNFALSLDRRRRDILAALNRTSKIMS